MAERGSAPARWAARVGVLASVFFLAGPLLAHVAVVSPMAGFSLFALSGMAGTIAAVIGVVAVFRSRGAARWSAGCAAGPALAVAAAFLFIAGRGGGLPAINDISTDTDHPPQFIRAPGLAANRGRDLAYPGDNFARQQGLAYPDLQPVRLGIPAARAYPLVLAAARRMPTWRLTRADGTMLALEGIDTTWLFRFQDDFVIEVRGEDNRSTVHMRSKSRDGKGDLGANAERIRAFLALVRETIGSDPAASGDPAR